MKGIKWINSFICLVTQKILYQASSMCQTLCQAQGGKEKKKYFSLSELSQETNEIKIVNVMIAKCTKGKQGINDNICLRESVPASKRN